MDGIRLGTPTGRWVLVATVLGSGITTLDGTVVNVALPRIGADLHADFAGLQWVVTGYTLTLASFILLGGALGDRYGRRRVFTIGIAWFAAASATCAAAPSLGWLIAGRMLQGVGGALLAPGSLAIISAIFAPEDRGRAVGAWSGLGGVTTAVGPFLGGWIVEVASWRWIFFLNLPLAAAVILLTKRHVPESIDESAPRRPDVAGALTAALGLGALTYGLIGKLWPVTGLGAALLVLFVVTEARSAHPMLPLAVFSNPVFSSINLLTFVIYAALAMCLFFVSLVLQQALGYPPLVAGAATVPITVIMLTLSSRSGALAQRIGPRLPLTAGPLIAGTGLALFNLVEPGRPYLTSMFPALVVFALGLSLIVSPLTATVLSSADRRHAGVVSGVNNAVARVAGLIAVASIPLLTGFDPFHQVGPTALISGFHRVALFAAAACAAASALAFTTLKERAPTPTPAPEPAPPPKPVHLPHPAQAWHCSVDAPPLTHPAPTHQP